MSSFIKMTPEALIALGTHVAATIGNETPNDWGTTAAECNTLTTADSGLTAAVNGQKAAEIVAKTATANKNTKKADLIAALNAIQATVVANPAVTNDMLVSLGFSPRRGGVKPQALTATGTVTGLTADPLATGTVKLRWNRSGNAPRTIFVVETSEDGANWTFLKSLTRCSYAAEGFAPGVAAWFRVTATTSTSASTPSLPVSVYAPGTAARTFTKDDLKIAA